MFTGIVTHLGELRSKENRNGDLRMAFQVRSPVLADARDGDSICVSGVCLTMLDAGVDGFCTDVSVETLAMTTLGDLAQGCRVNLELALRAADRLGGHLVSGHVDGRARLLSRKADARSERFLFEIPEGLARFVVPKGSVCIDGVSLTVNKVMEDRFEVCIIPHTLEVTTLGSLHVGQWVNFEVDMVARYLERLVQPGNPGG